VVKGLTKATRKSVVVRRSAIRSLTKVVKGLAKAVGSLVEAV